MARNGTHKSSSRLSPLMEQYWQIKKNYPDALLLFQVGDFYELFCDDAHKAAECLSIALTKRGTDGEGNPIPLCGVPCHVVESHLAKLVQAGFHVAICDQTEVAQAGKLVKRAVTQVLTPGTLTDPRFLDTHTASFLGFFFPTSEVWTLLFVEILTGQVYVTSFGLSEFYLLAELGRFMPDELVVPETSLGAHWAKVIKRHGYRVTSVNWVPFEAEEIRKSLADRARAWWQEQFQKYSGFLQSLKRDPAGSLASVCILLYQYLSSTNKAALSGLTQLSVYRSEEYMLLDAVTQRNLELVVSSQGGGKKGGTLLTVLDQAVTPMGSRLMRKWLLRPLVNEEQLGRRHETVAALTEQYQMADQIRGIMKRLPDLERVVGRMVLCRAQIEDYRQLVGALETLKNLREVLGHATGGLLEVMSVRLEDFTDIQDLLSRSISDEPDEIIQAGFDEELDRLRCLVTTGGQQIVALEKKEVEATGIRSLKIRYTGAHGYAIEVTKPNLHLVPERYQITQTLVSRSRFVTDELKNLEYACKQAEADHELREQQVFSQIQNDVDKRLPGLRRAAHVVSALDVLGAFAVRAREYQYVRPTFCAGSGTLEIIDARHPVLEALREEPFIANSVQLVESERLWVITGPNMGGKSTFLRQTALITIMAHIGSFVPASVARMSIVDRIFTRIGAADHVAAGASTFMVEMAETSVICTQATTRSLVILDEVGRGTSTIDGRALAQAVAEYLHTHIRPLCLFATHYHEVADSFSSIDGIGTYTMACKQTRAGIVLLHKLEPGVAQGSFGLEVAKQAQIPAKIIARAAQLIEQNT